MFMELWQRIFAAESIETAKKAFYLSAIIQPFLIGSGVFIGITAAALYPNIEGKEALFRVMIEFLPEGLLGLGLVSVLAILMSTVNSLVLVGGSTLYAGIFKHKIERKTERKQLRWLQILTLCFGLFSLLLAFIFTDLVKLLLMGAFIMMPMTPAIMWAVFSKNRNPNIAIASMILGLLTTILLINTMPETAFAPGFIVSLLVMALGKYFYKRQKHEYN